jgi:hypothetical protein
MPDRRGAGHAGGRGIVRGAGSNFAGSRLSRLDGKTPDLHPERHQERQDQQGGDGKSPAADVESRKASSPAAGARWAAAIRWTADVERRRREGMHDHSRLDLVLTRLAQRDAALVHEHARVLRAHEQICHTGRPHRRG